MSLVGTSGKDPRAEFADRTRAIVTIASSNYLPRARALLRSVQKHEPKVRRFFAVVDRPVVVGQNEPFEVIHLEDVGIPEFETFMAQYTLMEANTAVKPYVLQHLFAKYGFDEVVYLDPDILVLAPLDEVWKALNRGSVVLTPHLRDPFRDREVPTELNILQAGVYNLGFIALRREESTGRLLEWWGEKTESDCVVDWSGGMFVDQKWMDLVPGYLDGVEVLRDPGYNVAYWNLHEREVSESGGVFFAGGRPISFFHFSGYDPHLPARLSKHQTRHDLRSLPVLRRLFDHYASLLRAEGQDALAERRYGFSTLSNGVPISPVLRAAVRKLRKQGIPFPDVADADDFCRFLMTPNATVCGADISPFARQVLDTRPDVAAAYPGAHHDAEDPGFLHWLENCAHECESEELYARFKSALVRINPFDRIARIYRDRPDVQSVYPDAFRTVEGLEAFGGWLREYGLFETSIEPEEVELFLRAGRKGFENVVDYFFMRPELHALFPLAFLPCGSDFAEWLTRYATAEGELTLTEIRWFERRVHELDPSLLALLTALRNDWIRLRFPLAATRFGWKEFCTWLGAQAASRGHGLSALSAEPPHRLPILLQLEALHTTETYARRHPHALKSKEALREFAEDAFATAAPPGPSRSSERAELESAIRGYGARRGVNVAGYFHYAAGVGTSVRTLTHALDAAGIPFHEVTLPVGPGAMNSSDPSQGPVPSRFWRQHRVDFDVAITVANADAMRTARAFLGPSYEHGRRHIGYWVWETDRLPGNVAGAATGLECIWTPSEFSAAAIRHTLGSSVRVEVVPHAVVARTPRGRSHSPVALPKDRTLIGYFFDARSVIERKNPAALLRAFRRAFRADDRVTLVLKVNHAASGGAALREIETLAEGLPVVWIRDRRLDELETAALLNRLDIYASLHRAEGFGLVMAEAMSLGKAVIATGFSGNLDFMDNQCGRLVRHREIVTDQAHGPYPRGTRWADPDVEHAAELLRLLARDRGLREEIGRKAKHRIEQTLAPWVVGRAIRRLLGWERGDDVVPSGVSSSAVESRAPGTGSSMVGTEAAGGQRVVPRA